MLRKLMKHEWKATSRLFLLLYAFLIILTPIFSLLFRFLSGEHPLLNIVGGLGILGYVILCIGTFFATYVIIVMRHYNTLATTEAYLTFTIPANTHQIVISKVLISFIWCCISTLLLILSLISMTFIAGIWTFEQAGEFLSELAHFFDQFNSAPLTLFIILVILSAIIGALLTCLQFVFSVAIGQLSKNHRVLTSIGAYLASYMVIQWVTTLITFPIIFLSPSEEIIDTMQGLEIYYNYLNLSLGISIGLSLIFGIVFYFISVRIFKKKLNVI